MKIRLSIILAVFFHTLLAGSFTSLASEARVDSPARAGVFALKSGPAGVTLEFIPLADKETKVLKCGGAAGFIDVILPSDPGGSASIAQLNPDRVLIVRYEDGELHVTDQTGGSEGWKRPARRPDDLSLYNIRISVTSHTGSGWAFMIKEYERASADRIGPVVDLFKGKVPLENNGFIVCTDTYRADTGAKAYGEFRLDYTRHLFTEARLPGGKKGIFLVDLGGVVTAVEKSFLPEGTVIKEASMIQHSSSGKELLKYEPGGATGKIQSVVGHAFLPELQFGSTKFADLKVVVMEKLPDIFARDIVGILGIDLMRRAEAVSFAYPEDGSSQPMLRLADSIPGGATEIVETPFAVVNGHLMVRIMVNDVPVSFVMDTGAPIPILDTRAASASGIKGDEKSARKARGLDEGTASIMPAGAGVVRIGAKIKEEIPFFVGNLPVFDRMNTHGQYVGLLGNSFFARFKRVDIDFRREVVRFVR